MKEADQKEQKGQLRRGSLKAISENMQRSQRLTSGVLTQNAIHSLSDPRFLEPFRQRQQEAAKKEQEMRSKRKTKSNKLVSSVMKLREKYGHERTHLFEQCDKNECGAYLQYKKQKKDQAMPKDLAARRQRCVEWIPRPSPTSSPNQSDDEDDISNIGEMEHNAVQGLLGIATTQVSSERDNEEDDYGWAQM